MTQERYGRHVRRDPHAAARWIAPLGLLVACLACIAAWFVFAQPHGAEPADQGPATVALACSRATDEELEQIVKKGRRVEQVAAEGGDWPLADQEFHWAIIKASHNEYMRRLYPIINSAVNEILQIAHNRQKMQDTALADNRIILDFLLKRDEVGASHAMSIHMRHLINTLEEQ